MQHDFFLFSACKQMFLCLSSLGLISLLSSSEFRLFICKWKTSERRAGVGAGEREEGSEVFIFKATGGLHLKKHPAYLNVFVCMILN